MRFLILILLVITVSGGGCSESVLPEKAIVGSWKQMQLVKTPIEIEHVTEQDSWKAQCTFNSDKTYEVEFFPGKSTNVNNKFTGTYTVEGNNLTMVQSDNSATTQSTLKFEKDFMIVTFHSPVSAIGYYKRVN